MDTNKTFIQENIKDNEILIITKPVEINFSEISKPFGIKVSLILKKILINLKLLQNKKVALKEFGDNHVFAMADKCFNGGRHYVEFILESEPDEKNIIIGISLSRTDMNFSLSDAKNFWGYILSE